MNQEPAESIPFHRKCLYIEGDLFQLSPQFQVAAGANPSIFTGFDSGIFAISGLTCYLAWGFYFFTPE